MTRLDNIHSAVRSSVQFYKDRPNPGQPTPFSMDEFVHRIRHAVHISTVAVGYIALQIQVKVVNLGCAWLGTGHETHKVFSSVLSKSKTTHKLTDTLVLSLTINLIVQNIPSWQCFIMLSPIEIQSMGKIGNGTNLTALDSPTTGYYLIIIIIISSEGG